MIGIGIIGLIMRQYSLLSFFSGTGIRTITFVSGGYIEPSQRGTSRDDLVHIVDWTPTFLSIANINLTYVGTDILKIAYNTTYDSNPNNYTTFDGYDLAQSLLYNITSNLTSTRQVVPLNIASYSECDDGRNDIALVFRSSLGSKQLYKYMYLGSGLGDNVGYCNITELDDGKYETEYIDYNSYNEVESLFDLDGDTGETTNVARRASILSEAREHVFGFLNSSMYIEFLRCLGSYSMTDTYPVTINNGVGGDDDNDVLFFSWLVDFDSWKNNMTDACNRDLNDWAKMIYFNRFNDSSSNSFDNIDHDDAISTTSTSTNTSTTANVPTSSSEGTNKGVVVNSTSTNAMDNGYIGTANSTTVASSINTTRSPFAMKTSAHMTSTSGMALDESTGTSTTTTMLTNIGTTTQHTTTVSMRSTNIKNVSNDHVMSTHTYSTSGFITTSVSTEDDYKVSMTDPDRQSTTANDDINGSRSTMFEKTIATETISIGTLSVTNSTDVESNARKKDSNDNNSTNIVIMIVVLMVFCIFVVIVLYVLVLRKRSSNQQIEDFEEVQVTFTKTGDKAKTTTSTGETKGLAHTLNASHMIQRQDSVL